MNHYNNENNHRAGDVSVLSLKRFGIIVCTVLGLLSLAIYKNQQRINAPPKPLPPLAAPAPAAPVRTVTPEYSTGSGYSGSGSVSVKGYYRKDGTYVRPHSRSSRRR
ncbi:MAG: hypothetical protein WAQ98_11220 [Blastocatellia bacterium]